MNPELLQKYIAGNATEAEKQRVTEWIQENPENMREYMAQRRLHDMALWRTEPVAEENSPGKETFLVTRSMYGSCQDSSGIGDRLVGYTLLDRKTSGTGRQNMAVHLCAGGPTGGIDVGGWYEVWLNSRSTLTFPGSFKGDIRNVKLDGEGYFAVTKNVEQPFIVETNKCNVKVLGTEFNVMAYAADSVWETSLLEGAVEILVPGSNNSGMRLEPNMMPA